MTESHRTHHEPSTKSPHRHGLGSQPFGAIAEEAFLYSDLALDIPVKTLLEHLHGSDRLLLLIGAPGSGKSTQLLRLLREGGSDLLFCAFKAHPDASYSVIARTIRQYWTEPASEDTALVELLCTLCGSEQRPVLVIDDAHRLRPEILRAILRLRREVHRRCRRTTGVVLAGEPSLEALLDQAADTDTALEPRIRIRLHPLTLEQTEAYLHLRLQAAGAGNPNQLSGETARAIHRESGGIPLAINTAANQRLQSAGPEPHPEQRESEVGKTAALGTAPNLKKRRHALWVWGGALGMLALLVMLHLLPREDRRQEPLSLLDPRPLPTPDPEPRVRPSPRPLPDPEPVVSITPSSPITEEVETPSPDPPPEVPVAEPDPPPPVVEINPEPIRPAPITDDGMAGEAVPPEPDNHRTELRDAGWLNSRPADHFTIQIAAGDNRQALLEYARDLSLDIELALFRSRRDGSDWFTLLAGRFASASAAQAAIRDLPAPARRYQPWVRSFGSIQQSIADAR